MIIVISITRFKKYHIYIFYTTGTFTAKFNYVSAK